MGSAGIEATSFCSRCLF